MPAPCLKTRSSAAYVHERTSGGDYNFTGRYSIPLPHDRISRTVGRKSRTLPTPLQSFLSYTRLRDRHARSSSDRISGLFISFVTYFPVSLKKHGRKPFKALLPPLAAVSAVGRIRPDLPNLFLQESSPGHLARGSLRGHRPEETPLNRYGKVRFCPLS